MTLRLHVRTVELPLRHAWTIAHGTRTVQHNVIVSLTADGHTGYGEAASIPYYGQTAERITAALEAHRDLIEAQRLDDPAAMWDRLRPALGGERFALCALDQAAHDLWGKLHGQPVWKLWGLSLDRCPESDYTLGIDTIEKMVEKMREFEGFNVYKIKLGTDDDVAIVRELRRHTDAVFRVDANTAWTAEQTIANARALAELGVEFIEQPLPTGDGAGMRRVYAESVLPVIADESCILETDVERCAGLFHGVNIKLTKAGGMTPARRMIAEARRLGLRVMVGCMTESTVGISAIGQLLPLLDYVDMDGALLLARDVARGVRVQRGRAVFPDTPGNGVELLDTVGWPRVAGSAPRFN